MRTVLVSLVERFLSEEMGWTKCRAGGMEIVEGKCSAADRVGFFACAEGGKGYSNACPEVEE